MTIVRGDLMDLSGNGAPLGEQERLNEATRWLSSRVLVDDKFRDRVYRLLCIPSARCIAPAPGIDLPALARHAAWAVEDEIQTRRRTAQIALVGVALVAAGPVVLLAGGPWWVPLAAGLALLLGAAGYVVERRARRAARGRHVFHHEVVEKIGRDLLPREQCDRLEQANAGDLLVYDERRTVADEPGQGAFPGFGDLVGHEVRVPVDISKALDDNRPRGRVTPHDLMVHLTRKIPRHIDLTAITDDCSARLVAHVHGDAVASMEGMLTRSGSRVVARAPAGLVERAANRPTRAVRAYVVAQIVGHEGQLVTTVHTSAVLGTTGLSLNIVIHVLTPLREAYEKAREVPGDVWLRRLYVARTHKAVNLVRRSPGEWRRLRRLRREAQRSERLPGRARLPIRRRRPTEADPYGAHRSVRDRPHQNFALRYTERVDLQRQVNDLMRAIFRETEAYLEAHNIDGSAFRDDAHEAMQTVTNNITTVIGALVQGSTVAGSVSGDAYTGMDELADAKTT